MYCSWWRTCTRPGPWVPRFLRAWCHPHPQRLWPEDQERDWLKGSRIYVQSHKAVLLLQTEVDSQTWQPASAVVPACHGPYGLAWVVPYDPLHHSWSPLQLDAQAFLAPPAPLQACLMWEAIYAAAILRKVAVGRDRTANFWKGNLTFIWGIPVKQGTESENSTIKTATACCLLEVVRVARRGKKIRQKEIADA